ncbi:InlB B-repeat-containing protein [Amygdalobacter indicium]|uniref:InlB B-repeat-containing protein n=1 Tax=Amygdalobacter indicium TaxID=3029272 RepID=UPI0027A4AC7D|nr:InlB B-repeat-containing protein [Amygdalobacter indicium]WEG34528.1 InlB B-repeat-containing protein [Amygdalobacter indicium]
MKNVVKSYVPVLLAVLLIFTGRPGNVGASEPTGEKTGVIRSIFNADKSRESAVTLDSKPKGPVDKVGEIVVAEGQTVTDEGFINTFWRDEDFVGKLQYGTMTFSTSIAAYYDDSYKDLENGPLDMGYMDSFRPEYDSSVSVNYDLKNNTGGTTPIKYSFIGKKSTGNKYIYLYFHYTLLGKAKNGQQIAARGYLGYKIKVVPNEYSAFLTYNANGGKINGVPVYKDEANKQYSDKLDTVHVPIIKDLPVRDGYKFVGWYEPISYKFLKNVYNNEKNLLDTSIYPVPKEKNLTEYDLWPEAGGKTKEIFAAWDKMYQLTYDADGGETTPPTQVGTFGLDMSNMTQQETDKKLQVAPAIAKNGFVFKGWKAEDGTVYQAGSDFIIKFAAPEQKLTAVWERTTQPQPPVVPPAPNPVTPPVTPVTPQPQLTPQPSTMQPSAGNGEPEVSAGHKAYTVAKTGETKAFSVSLSLVILALTALAALKRREI